MTPRRTIPKLLDAMQTHGLVDEFIARAKPNVGTPDLFLWLRSLPQLTTVLWPMSLRAIRRKLNCSAAHGGVRGANSRRTLYRVTRAMKTDK